MPEQTQNPEKQSVSTGLPLSVKLAAQVAAEHTIHLDPEETKRFTGALKGLAVRLERSGAKLTPEVLAAHAEKGIEHIRKTARELTADKRSQTLTYGDAKRSFAGPDEADLLIINGTVEELVAYRQRDERAADEALVVRMATLGKNDMLRHMNTAGVDLVKTGGESALISAAANNFSQTVAFLADEGVDVNALEGMAVVIAAQLGRFETLKTLHEHGADLDVKDGLALTSASLYNAPDCARFLIAHTSDVNNHEGAAVLGAIKNGDIELLKRLQDAGAKVPAREGWDIVIAAMEGGLDMVKYLHEECGLDIRYNDDEPLLMAGMNGHEDIMDYLREKGAEMGPRAEQLYAHNAHYGNLYASDYMQRHGIEPPGTDHLKLAAECKQFHVLAYFEERGVDVTAVLDDDQKQQFENSRARVKEWRRHFGWDIPHKLNNMPVDGFRLSTFNTVLDMLAEHEDQRRDNCSLAAYNLTMLFRTPDRVLKYMKEWGQQGEHPLLSLAEGLHIPETGRPDYKAWGDAVLKHGPEMAKLMAFAHKVEKPADTLNKTRQVVAHLAYDRGAENPDLARTAFSLLLNEDTFNKTLDVMNRQTATGGLNKTLPALDIPGDAFGMDGARFFRLDADDTRGPLLGHYVDCCQSVGHPNGTAPAEHGVTSPDGAFYVLTDKRENIIGISWAWRGADDELVFDSVENLKERVTPDQWAAVMDVVTVHVARDHPDISRVMMGTDGNSGIVIDKPVTGLPAQPKDHPGYRDSGEQYKLWQRNGNGLDVYKATVEDLADLDRLEDICFSKEVYDHDIRMSLNDFVRILKSFKPAAALPESKEDPNMRVKPDHVILVAKADAQVLGYVELDFGPDEDPDVPENSVNITSIAIDPAAGAMGLGRFRVAEKLLRAVDLVARTERGAQNVHVEVHEENAMVIRSLKRLGFEEMPRMENYFSDGGAAIRLKRALDERGMGVAALRRTCQADTPETPAAENDNTQAAPVARPNHTVRRYAP